MNWAETKTYLNVITPSNLKFDQHMALKKDRTSKTLGPNKHFLKLAPQKGQLLAYTSLCRPILAYADSVEPKLAKTLSL